jgi:hypothetical protein
MKVDPHMSLKPPADSAASPPNSRWHFLRDVLVMQIKLVLGNLLNFVIVPISLGAALLDLLVKGEREGARFYQVLAWARDIEEGINVYGAIGGYHATHGEPESPSVDETDGDKPNFNVDTVIRRVETVIVREYEKGGTAASLKSAVDRVLNQMRRESGGKPGAPPTDADEKTKGDA